MTEFKADPPQDPISTLLPMIEQLLVRVRVLEMRVSSLPPDALRGGIWSNTPVPTGAVHDEDLS